MYKEVALDPLCMSDMAYYSLVKQHFGFEKGRYISADIKSWAKEAMQAVKNSDLKPVRAKSIKNFLNQVARSKNYDGFVITEDRKATTANDWSSWWVAQNKIRPFSFTISDSACPTCIDIEQINNGSVLAKWDVPPSTSVKRTEQEIISTLYPLIVLSNEVLIVDQYFRVDYNSVLEDLFKALSHSTVKKITIVSAQNVVNLNSVYQEKYKPLNINNIEFEWITAPDKFFHVRFFITDKGAIKSDYGFMNDVEKGAHSDFAIMGLVSQSDVERTYHELDKILSDGRASSIVL